MIFVTVGYDQSLDLVAVVLDIFEIRQNNVDAEHIVVGEHESAVDDDRLVFIFEHCHVLTDFTESADRDNLKLVPGRSALAL